MIKRIDNYDLSAQNTFRMRVSCACYIEYDSAADLGTIDFDSLPKPILSIGEGSNLLFTKEFEGTVLCSKIKYIKYLDEFCKRRTLVSLIRKLLMNKN